MITLYKEDFAKYKDRFSKYKKEVSTMKLSSKKWILEHIDVDRINIDIAFGLGDVFVTSMAIPVVSSIIAILLQKYLSKTSKRFSVKPMYNKLFLNVKGATYISLRMIDLIYIIFRILKESKKERIKKEKKTNIMFDKDFVKT